MAEAALIRAALIRAALIIGDALAVHDWLAPWACAMITYM